MDSENKNGQTQLSIRVNGPITKPKEKESSFTQMETTMRVSGKTIRLMDMECMCIAKLGPSMKAIGSKICSTAQE